ncbi:MAG TPA: DUF1385 domain-containing protein [Gaiellales bacterium]
MATIGGQAVLEGVMMRGPSSWAVAVRRPDGRISEIEHDVESVALRRRWLRLPVVRGVVALGESLAIGMRALSVSARFSVTDEGEEDASEELSRWAMIASFVFAIGFSVALFKVSPALLTNWINPGNTLVFVLVEGGIRVSLLVAYLALIGLSSELRRVFQYHAAEHKAINAYEAGAPLEPQEVQRHSLIHLRCGTAFLLWVMVIAILVFAALGEVVGHLAWYWLVVSRIVALPLIAGLAYEIIRMAAKFERFRIVRIVLAPGLWLQRLTTREPTLDQVAVSIAALERVLEAERKSQSELGPRVEVMA